MYSMSRSMNRQPVGAILLLLLSQVFSSCPMIENLRTNYVASSFNPQRLNGFWFEIAYQDIAQIGETCQYYNKTVNSNNSGVSEQFGFTYSEARHMNLQYTNTATVAVYTKALARESGTASSRKHADANFHDKSGIPTVVVDVTVNADGSYETLTEYACYEVGPVTYEEIRLGARTPTVSSATLLGMEQVLRQQGVAFKHLRTVDQSENCTYA